ncbi:hypothetical protein [Streptomyces xiamenensis]|uniref:hypothetical protein n=1 Tax=Streptomyces xiamenensis TaxID=408015 RepID=UPI0035E00320
MFKLSRRTAAVAVATAVVVGGGVVAAPTASAAVGSIACTNWSKDKGNHRVTANLNFRTGPGKSYTSKGLVLSGTGVKIQCSAPGYAYVIPKSGAWKDQKGWVTLDHITNLFN